MIEVKKKGERIEVSFPYNPDNPRTIGAQKFKDDRNIYPRE